MRIFIGLLIAWANVSFSQVPNECMHIVSKYNGMIQKKPAAAVAYNQAKAQELSNCSASYNLRINAQREREAESRSRANVINAETSNQEAINQAKRADEQDLNQIRAARIEESKKICLGRTQKAECNPQTPYFQCFDYQNAKYAFFKTTDNRCFVTDCECFNFYKN